ncbi:hypothetical protein T492DRAFT_931973, partial [Pavlovales sp. CCMP2436]
MSAEQPLLEESQGPGPALESAPYSSVVLPSPSRRRTGAFAARAASLCPTPNASRTIVAGFLFLLLAAGLGALGGALHDRSRASRPQPELRPRPSPAKPHRPVPPTEPPQPGPAERPSSPYVGPAGENPPDPAVCHFTQPSNAHDPTAKEPGRDGDGMRNVLFVNHCAGDLMINIQGFTFWDTGRWHMQQLPHDGGFPLAKGEEKMEQISERMFSGRIWARPNCKRPCNIVSCGNPHDLPCIRDGTWCDSGNCPGGNETTCRGSVGQFIGGLPPGPLLELTLCGGRGARIACYKDGPAYDQKEVLRGRRLTGSGAPSGRFNCGGPMMPGPFDMRDCPRPLRIARNDSDPHGAQVAWSAPGQPKSKWTADRRLSQSKMSTQTQDEESLVD